MGPCGTCGAIRVGAVSALFAPNAKMSWREHRGPSAFMMRWMGVGCCRVPVCERETERERELKAERQWGNLRKGKAALDRSECGL